MKVAFLGTPFFGARILDSLLASKHNVIAVITQPDKANQRGNKVKLSPVKETALNNSIPIYQFNKISTEGIETLKSLNADIFVTAAYGQILSQQVLDTPKYGVINVHASLLPKYRGASPVQCAILNGEEKTGVTIMKTALSVDSGDIILTKELKLNGDENSDEVLLSLAELGGEAIIEALNLIENGKASFTPQNHNAATFCKKIAKEDLIIDFNNPALKIKNQIRAFSQTPGAYFETKNGRLKVLKAEVIQNSLNASVSEVTESGKTGIVIKCGEDSIKPLIVQGEGGKDLTAAEYFRGKPVKAGEKLNELS